jgi:hypothetical protein
MKYRRKVFAEAGSSPAIGPQSIRPCCWRPWTVGNPLAKRRFFTFTQQSLSGPATQSSQNQA